MILIFIVVFVLTIGVQMWLRNTYGKWQKVPAASGLTGAQTARTILDANGLNDVKVTQVPGALTDHYDPRQRVVSLSPANYQGSSVAAHAVASHEVGHAIQHATSYAPLQVRTALVPVANLGARFAPWLIIAGALLGVFGLIQIGVIFFAGAVLFQLVTLPVEFNASSRAFNQLQTLGIATSSEIGGTKQVLNAAAMTYVAAAASSVMYLLYYVSMFMGGRD